ncbi:hypothetical protein OLMES_2816 [Oleiphilus messinensis]|uniref:Uncharacterized protein n=2 Tax=Oleiphilus messinensis TaxID=141451 RepID=A0A1Y0IBU4_9GAMM|nr:hypothetical protein OLMES_2816 [Oleiphilus messinensis]
MDNCSATSSTNDLSLWLGKGSGDLNRYHKFELVWPFLGERRVDKWLSRGVVWFFCIVLLDWLLLSSVYPLASGIDTYGALFLIPMAAFCIASYHYVESRTLPPALSSLGFIGPLFIVISEIKHNPSSSRKVILKRSQWFMVIFAIVYTILLYSFIIATVSYSELISDIKEVKEGRPNYPEPLALSDLPLTEANLKLDAMLLEQSEQLALIINRVRSEAIRHHFRPLQVENISRTLMQELTDFEIWINYVAHSFLEKGQDIPQTLTKKRLDDYRNNIKSALVSRHWSPLNRLWQNASVNAGLGYLGESAQFDGELYRYLITIQRLILNRMLSGKPIHERDIPPFRDASIELTKSTFTLKLSSLDHGSKWRHEVPDLVFGLNLLSREQRAMLRKRGFPVPPMVLISPGFPAKFAFSPFNPMGYYYDTW